MERFYLAVARIAKQTLHHMVEHRIPMMPETYSRHFYRFLSDTDNDSREIIENQQEFDLEESVSHQEQVMTVMNDFAELIDNLDRATGKHNHKLDNHLLKLKTSQTHADLTQLKREISQELELVIENNNQIRENIQGTQDTIRELQKKMEEVADMATIDELTGLYNRRALLSRLLEELNRAERYGHYFSILLLDIDDFKQVNDTYGHQVGDAILHGFGEFLRHSLRDSDFPARFGGEEFICFLPATDSKQAVSVGEKIRSFLAQNSLCSKKSGLSLRITVSIGVSSFISGDSLDSLIKRADDALYQAKHQGKNRIVTDRQTGISS